jgi:hypothetical protein
MKNKNLISISQLSRELKIPVVWLKLQADKGVLPCVDAGGKLLFNLQTVQKKLIELASKGVDNE